MSLNSADFVGMGLGMQVALDTRWFNQTGSGMWACTRENSRIRNARSFFPASSTGSWGAGARSKACSPRVPRGSAWLPCNVYQGHFRVSRDWVYFEVSRGNEAWKDIQTDQSLAMRLNHSIISNPDELRQGARVVDHELEGSPDRAPVRSVRDRRGVE